MKILNTLILFLAFTVCANAQSNSYKSNEQIFVKTVRQPGDECSESRDHLYVQATGPLNFLEILDSDGDILLSTRKRKIDISRLRKGRYFVSGRIRDQFVVKQFQKI